MVIAYRVVRSKGGQVTKKKRRNKVLVYRSFESGGREGAGSSSRECCVLIQVKQAKAEKGAKAARLPTPPTN